MQDRYARQEVLRIIGKEGQKRLGQAVVGIVGLGALGSVAAELLARAGVGTLVLCDGDIVELDNLQRQALYAEADIGKQKVSAATHRLREINSAITITAHAKHITTSTVALLADVHVILDCTDNLQARFLCNEYAMRENIPFIYCGAVETRGMVYVVDPESGRACFNCLFSSLKSVENCEDAGVLNVTTHTAASLQVTEALKVLLGRQYCRGLRSFDVWSGRFEEFGVQARSDCPVCAGTYDRLTGNVPPLEFCVTKRSVKVRPNKGRSVNLEKLGESCDVLERLDGALRIRLDGREVLVTRDGFLELAVRDQDEARRIAEHIYTLT